MKRCIHFDGGVCYAQWEKTQDNPTGFFGEGCYRNHHNSCPHEKLVEFIECPNCKNDISNKNSCKTCYGNGLVPRFI